MKLRLLKTLTM